MDLFSREHPKVEPGGWFLWLCLEDRSAGLQGEGFVSFPI